MRILLTMLVLSAVTGCATKPVTAERATPAPADRVHYSGDGSARLVVTRDSGLLGGGCYLGLLLNGDLAARLGTGETVTLPVPPGEHLLGIGNDPKGGGLCGLSSMTIREIATTVEGEQSKRFRLLGDMDGGFTIAPSSF